MTKRKDPKDFLPNGRPTKYKAEFSEQSYKYCLLGATDKQLASFFEVSESTINLWKNEPPKFSESIKRGKEIADGKIAEALYRRGISYSHSEEKIFNNSGEVLRVETTQWDQQHQWDL